MTNGGIRDALQENADVQKHTLQGVVRPKSFS